jgi:hypothetical protein
LAQPAHLVYRLPQPLLQQHPRLHCAERGHIVLQALELGQVGGGYQVAPGGQQLGDLQTRRASASASVRGVLQGTGAALSALQQLWQPQATHARMASCHAGCLWQQAGNWGGRGDSLRRPSLRHTYPPPPLPLHHHPRRSRTLTYAGPSSSTMTRSCAALLAMLASNCPSRQSLSTLTAKVVTFDTTTALRCITCQSSSSGAGASAAPRRGPLARQLPDQRSAAAHQRR